MFYGAVYYLLIRKPAKLLAFGGNAYVFIAAIKATPWCYAWQLDEIHSNDSFWSDSKALGELCETKFGKTHPVCNLVRASLMSLHVFSEHVTQKMYLK